jgi:hypothetical protein
MAEEMPAKPPATETVPDMPLDGPHGVMAAPMIYADWLGSWGHTGTVINLTLGVHKYSSTETNESVAGRQVVVHLRMPLHTAQALNEAISMAELALVAPASPEKN